MVGSRNQTLNTIFEKQNKSVKDALKSNKAGVLAERNLQPSGLTRLVRKPKSKTKVG